MSYVIESNVPLDSVPLGRPASIELLTMRALKVGDSFLITDGSRADHARWMVRRLKPACFSVRKVSGQGWRVWRVA